MLERYLRFFVLRHQDASKDRIRTELKEVNLAAQRENKPASNGMDIPDHVIESIARSLLPVIRSFYESEEGQRAFEEWQLRQKGSTEPESSR